jgi:hypothetical protein
MRIFTLLLLCLLFKSSLGQKTKELNYPKNYFMFPIKPGQSNHLSGSLGDLRSMHFHGGLDIKTDQREGLEVYAAADGYVKEIRISTSGYGNGLYIQHPNGLFTVYGHLRSYEGTIQNYAFQKRQAAESFELSIKPEANEIPIKKGEIIGYSGNSGGSGGPHLHFEIRNEFNNLLNPLYFGFSEIKDNQTTNIKSLILRTLATSARVEGRYGRQYFYPKGTAGSYYLSEPILAKGSVGLELLAFDKMNYNQNNYGISCIEVLVNNKEKFYYHLEKIPVEDSKDINLHTDFALEKITGQKFQRLYLADGNNQLPIYKVDQAQGKLNVLPGQSYNITVKCWDSYENLSSLNFQILGDTNTSAPVLKPNIGTESIDYHVDENTLVLNLSNIKNLDTPMELGVNGKIVPLNLAYIQGNKAVYLYDLRMGLPQFAEYGDIQKDFSFKKTIPAGVDFKLLASNYSLVFGKQSLYDTLHLEMSKKGAMYKIGESTIPLRETIDIEINTNNIDTEKQSAYWIYGNTKRFLTTLWQGTTARFKSKDLGDFAFLTDNTAPTIKPLAAYKNKLVFKIDDELSGIKNFRAEVNGAFVLMDYDYKKDLIWSVTTDSTANYAGQLKLSVTDNQGNVNIFEKEIGESTAPAPRAVIVNKKNNNKKKSSSKKAVKTKKKVAKKRKR